MNDPDSRPERDEDTGADAEPPQRLCVQVIVEDGDWSAFHGAEAAIAAAAQMMARTPGLDIGAAEASVALSSDARVAALNGAYRGKPRPTNVLSFPSPPGQAVENGDARYLGDIVLAAETVSQEAAAEGIPPIHHLQHLVVHGLLHLLGFDHESEPEAEEMEGLETAILKRLGVADPYAAAASS